MHVYTSMAHYSFAAKDVPKHTHYKSITIIHLIKYSDPIVTQCSKHNSSHSYRTNSILNKHIYFITL